MRDVYLVGFLFKLSFFRFDFQLYTPHSKVAAISIFFSLYICIQISPRYLVQGNFALKNETTGVNLNNRIGAILE